MTVLEIRKINDLTMQKCTIISYYLLCLTHDLDLWQQLSQDYFVFILCLDCRFNGLSMQDLSRSFMYIMQQMVQFALLVSVPSSSLTTSHASDKAVFHLTIHG